ncbi:MAG: sugar ABC transporter permease [Actinomycetia bacterium]|nr:sugar ABC transporter permease [Actinomycetes bacterium]
MSVTVGTVEDRRRNARRRRREARIGASFVAPFAILFLFVFIAPIVTSIRAAFYRDQPAEGGLYGGGGTVSTFIGFGNFRDVLDNPELMRGLGRVMLFGAIQIPIMIGGALILALLIDSYLVKRGTFFKLSYFLPYAIPGVVAALVWVYIYNPRISPINQALEAIGLDGISFFAPGTVLWSMANMTTWTFMGYNMLVFLAALQSIPRDLYEAARLDGSSEFGIVRWIKVPLVRNATLLTVLLSIIGTIQLFNEPTVVATQNPWMGNAYTPMMMAYNSMMGQVSPSGAGPASAVSLIMALVAAVLAALYAVLQRRGAR